MSDETSGGSLRKPRWGFLAAFYVLGAIVTVAIAALMGVDWPGLIGVGIAISLMLYFVFRATRRGWEEWQAED